MKAVREESDRPLVSLLIPTRNRPTMAVSTIRAALEGSPSWTEVVVAENSDPNLRLSPLAEPRLRILPSPASPLTMSENWERLIAASRGEWVLVLSDKYHLVPSAIARLEPLLRADVATVIAYGKGKLVQSLPHDGRRSTAQELLAGAGRLDYAALLGPCTEWRSFEPHRREWLERCDYDDARPMLYTALVRRAIIDGFRERAGLVFPGAAPDIASGLQLALDVPRYLRVRLPLVLMQWPSCNPSSWSAGVAVATGSPEGRGFHQFEASGRSRLPPTLPSVVFDTTQAVVEARRCVVSLPQRARWSALAEGSTRQLLHSHSAMEALGALGDLVREAAGAGALPSALYGVGSAALAFGARPVRAQLDPVVRRLLRRLGIRTHLQRLRGTTPPTPRVESTHAGVADALAELARLWVRDAAELVVPTQDDAA
jgi:hypothetical protein